MQLYEPNLVSFRAGTRSAPAPSIMVPKALAHHAGPEVVVSAPPCTQLIRPTSPPSGSRVLTRSHKKGPAGQLAVVKPPQQPGVEHCHRIPKRQKRSRVTALIDPPRSTTPAAEQQPSQPADRIETLEQFAVAIGNPGQPENVKDIIDLHANAHKLKAFIIDQKEEWNIGNKALSSLGISRLLCEFERKKGLPSIMVPKALAHHAGPFAIGMCVKLTVDLCPEHGLCNGAHGTVVDIFYPNGYAPAPPASSDEPTRRMDPRVPTVVVEFPDSKCYPIAGIDLFIIDYYFREGLPLISWV